MVVGCDWSATGCRYSVTVALDTRGNISKANEKHYTISIGGWDGKTIARPPPPPPPPEQIGDDDIVNL